jgi:formylglycine-generating enzyme required for sulfatase activity
MRACLLALALVAGASMASAGEDRVYEGDATARSVRDYVARLLGQDWAGDSRRYALVVGISDYGDDAGYRDLPTADDAHRMRRFLIEEAGFDHVHVLTEEHATKARIEELMDGVFPRLVDGNDRFLFYWSGHGDQRALAGGGERGYLPLAGSKRGQWWRMIGMDDIEDWDETLRARQALYLLDACFSGLAGVAAKSRLRDLTLEQLARPSRQLLTAGTAEEEAIAGDRWGGSLFTTAVLDGLRGAADATTAYAPDGVVSFSELVGYVKLRVADEKERAGWRSAITPQPRDLRVNQGEFFVVLPPEADPEADAGPASDAAPAGKGAAALTAAEVEEIQAMLAALGFDPGPVDGIFGLRTRGALLRFQRERDLDETAEWDAATERAMLRAWAGKARALDPSVTDAPADDEPPTTPAPAGAPFRDCDVCPEMIPLAGGTFQMGSPPDEEGRWDDEGPRHAVTVPPFALAKHEVTFEQFDACVAAGGCPNRPADPGWGRGDRPVINVSWHDAQAYVAWLSEIAGEPYRLPSEAEWEFAARAGTDTRFAFGDAWIEGAGNCDGYADRTVEVGSFQANAWGFHDLHGNVWEWVEDRWHDSYAGAPADGSAWIEGDSADRVFRGGSWVDEARGCRAAYRDGDHPGVRLGDVGFRPARGQG